LDEADELLLNEEADEILGMTVEGRMSIGVIEAFEICIGVEFFILFLSRVDSKLYLIIESQSRGLLSIYRISDNNDSTITNFTRNGRFHDPTPL
jgi:hypothetical protein